MHNPQTDLLIKTAQAPLDYSQVFAKMLEFTHNRNNLNCDEIWILQHQPVLTLGRKADPKHILNSKKIPIVQTDRGGEVTYHAPGQLVVYFLLDLDKLQLDIGQLIFAIESLIMQTLQSFAIKSYARKEAHGVYVNLDAPFVDKICKLEKIISEQDEKANGAYTDKRAKSEKVNGAYDEKNTKYEKVNGAYAQKSANEAKIASLGLRIHKNFVYHGLALNVDMDMSGFDCINPCGYAGMQMTQLQNFGNFDFNKVQNVMINLLDQVFLNRWKNIKISDLIL